MDVSVVKNVDASSKSLKDTCMVELVVSPRGDDKRQRFIGDDSNDMSYVEAMQQDDIWEGW